MAVVIKRGRGRPPKAFDQLKESTKLEYARRAVRNAKKMQEAKGLHGYNIREVHNRTSIPALKKGSEAYLREAYESGLHKKNYVQNQYNMIREKFAQGFGDVKDGDILYKMTNEEIKDFFNSKYYVEVYDNKYTSDGLKAYYDEYGEDVQMTRLIDFIEENLSKERQTELGLGSTFLKRI